MNRLFFIAFILISILTSLTKCTEQQSSIETVDTLESVEPVFDEITDRLIEVQKCAKCHQEEYESWLAGPHANAYKGLMNHGEHVDNSANFSLDYKEFLKLRLKDVCASCHTGKNLYESNYLGLESENNDTKHNASNYPKAFNQVQKRTGNYVSNLSTGVDCMTCHSHGKQNVTNYSSKAKGKEGHCELIKSKFFESNQNCFACHHHQVKSMDRLISEKKLKSEQNCVQCHQQYTSHGKGTHYYYWRKDSINISRPERLNLFQSIEAKLIKEKGECFVEVSWINDFLPHDFSECGEAVLQIEVLNSRGIIEGNGEIRINRKRKMEALGPKHFTEGVAGFEFIYLGEPAKKRIKIKSNTNLKINLVGCVKPQYWSADLELERIYSRSIKL